MTTHYTEQARILSYFKFSHLPPHLVEVSEPFSVLAHSLMARPYGLQGESLVGLRKLMEVKDMTVRAQLWPADAMSLNKRTHVTDEGYLTEDRITQKTYFRRDHLKDDLRTLSDDLFALSEHILSLRPCPQRSTALDRLIEAKDCFVRALLEVSNAP